MYRVGPARSRRYRIGVSIAVILSVSGCTSREPSAVSPPPSLAPVIAKVSHCSYDASRQTIQLAASIGWGADFKGSVEPVSGSAVTLTHQDGSTDAARILGYGPRGILALSVPSSPARWSITDATIKTAYPVRFSGDSMQGLVGKQASTQLGQTTIKDVRTNADGQPVVQLEFAQKQPLPSAIPKGPTGSATIRSQTFFIMPSQSSATIGSYQGEILLVSYRPQGGSTPPASAPVTLSLSAWEYDPIGPVEVQVDPASCSRFHAPVPPWIPPPP